MKTLKSLKELRTILPFTINNTDNCLKYLARRENQINFDVYLLTKGVNLQRSFVWTIEQKREFIMSILLGRKIMPIAYICVPVVSATNDINDVYQIIDGKQRLSTTLDFVKDRFSLVLEGKEFLFSQLPQDYQTAINGHYFNCLKAVEYLDYPISDDAKIQWFKLINHAGTPMDKEHMDSLE